jgi:tRNA modification GTPase
MDLYYSGSDTIVAPATPPGRSGLAVVRLSGPKAVFIADDIFMPFKGHETLSKQPGYRLVPGYVPGVDDVVAAVFRAPNSPTGEDVVEITCHGGTAVRQLIIEKFLSAGARAACAGEFTKRAFLNGKLDLSQAEAVADLIGAEANRQANAAYRQLKGSLGRIVRLLSDRLHALRAKVELFLEFPDHEQTAEAVDGFLDRLAELKDDIRDLGGSYRQGKLLAGGLEVALVGRPNAGKSSLMNALVGSERAIVTPTPGTTRDTIEAKVSLDGYLVTLIDTAGLTETDDPIEEEGVRRAEAARDAADLILYLVASDEPDEVIAAELSAAKALLDDGKRLILLRSKADLRQAIPSAISYCSDRKDQERQNSDQKHPDRSGLGRDEALFVSALTGEGLDDLKTAIAEVIGAGIDRADVVVTNARHRDALMNAADSLESAEQGIKADLTFDLIAVLLNEAAMHLAAITGDDVTEVLVEAIFSQFCIGK